MHTNLKTVSGCATRLTVTVTAPEGADKTLTAYCRSCGDSHQATVEGDTVIFPPLSAGEHLYELRAGGIPVIHGHLIARPSAFPVPPMHTVDHTVTADLDGTTVANISVTLNQGARGPKGDPGLTDTEHALLTAAANGALWLPGRTGSVTLAGQQGDGVAISSANNTSRVQVQDSGVTITARRTPQWLEAGDTPAFHDIRTAKDLTATDESLATALAAKQDTLPSVSVKQHYADYLSDLNAARPVIKPTGSWPVPDSGWRYIVLPGGFNNGGLISGVTFTNNAMLRKYAWLAVFQQPEGGSTEPDATWQLLGVSREDVMTAGLKTPLTWEFDPMQATPGRMLCIGVYYTKPTAWTKPDGILVTTYASSGSGGGGWGTADAYNSNSSAYCMPLATLIYSGVDFGQTVKSHLESPYCHLSRSQFAAMEKLIPAASSPVQNSTAAITAGGVYTALGNRSSLKFDTTPTAGSTNLMTSGSIYTALESAGSGGSSASKVWQALFQDQEAAPWSQANTLRDNLAALGLTFAYLVGEYYGKTSDWTAAEPAGFPMTLVFDSPVTLEQLKAVDGGQGLLALLAATPMLTTD